MWPPLRDGLVQNLSGDRGHAEIGQNEGIAAFGKHGEGCTATPGRVRVMTEAGQEIHQEVTDLRVVVDDQDVMGQAASPSVAAEAVWSSFAVQLVPNASSIGVSQTRSCEEASLTPRGSAHEDAARELACGLTDRAGFAVSESTVYRVLKRHGLIRPVTVLGFPAGREYRVKSTRPNEQ